MEYHDALGVLGTMRFSTFFGLNKRQAELDFVDINTSQDMRLFIDPYAIEMRDDELSAELAHHITTFFEDVLSSLRKKDRARAKLLTGNLGEPQETFLGMSKGKPQGRGMGRFDTDQLLRALEASRAFKTGLITDLAEAELFIEGIGPDKISDLTTNLIRAPLITYTHQQCELHGVPLTKQVPIAPVWDPDVRDWRSEYQDLPVVNGEPVILVPKVLVRLKLALNSQEYYNGAVLNFLRAEHLGSNSGLVRLLKNRTRKVFKKDLKEKHPFSKEFLAEVTQKNPRILEFYKELRGARGALENEDLEKSYSETEFANTLSDRLRAIKPGRKYATEYHTAIAGVLTFLFYPELVSPVLEEGLHSGRKRIDLTFTNWSNSGFFSSLKSSPQTRARYIIIECKNYSEDLANPEFDQLTGRFSPVRGRFGIICCRKNQNKMAILQRSKDAVRDDRGFVLVLDDDDILALLDAAASGRRKEIFHFLDRRYRDIVF